MKDNKVLEKINGSDKLKELRTLLLCCILFGFLISTNYNRGLEASPQRRVIIKDIPATDCLLGFCCKIKQEGMLLWGCVAVNEGEIELTDTHKKLKPEESVKIKLRVTSSTCHNFRVGKNFSYEGKLKIQGENLFISFSEMVEPIKDDPDRLKGWLLKGYLEGPKDEEGNELQVWYALGENAENSFGLRYAPASGNPVWIGKCAFEYNTYFKESDDKGKDAKPDKWKRVRWYSTAKSGGTGKGCEWEYDIETNKLQGWETENGERQEHIYNKKAPKNFKELPSISEQSSYVRVDPGVKVKLRKNKDNIWEYELSGNSMLYNKTPTMVYNGDKWSIAVGGVTDVEAPKGWESKESDGYVTWTYTGEDELNLSSKSVKGFKISSTSKTWDWVHWHSDSKEDNKINFGFAGKVKGPVFKTEIYLPAPQPIPFYDPPIWGSIVAFPTPERSFRSDLNGNSDFNDTILHYLDLETGEIFNTELIVSEAHHAVDIYERTIAFVDEDSQICYYDIDTGTLGETGAKGLYPSIFGSIITFTSEGTIWWFDLSTQTLVDTEVPGVNPTIYENTIAFHSTPESTILTYDLSTGAATDTGIAGKNPTIYGTVIAFETSEFSLLDLNGDGDTNDCVIRYYDLETQIVVNTGAVGTYPALYGNRIVFATPEGEINQDLNGDGKIIGNIIRYYDLEMGEVVNTKELGTEPDIYEDTITFYFWEHWTVQDLNGDGDLDDPIGGIYQIGTRELAIEISKTAKFVVI